MRLALLSDLHVGMHRADLVAPMLAALTEARPDAILIAGDIVHRATPQAFAEAATLLSRLPAPWIAVPGNHDIPLKDIIRRLLVPFARWDALAPSRAPVRDAAGARIVGLNSTEPLLWRRGRVCDSAAQAAAQALRSGAGLKVAMLHHPLAWIGDESKELALGAAPSFATLDEAGADLLLTGHLHAFAAAQMPSGLVQLHLAAALCDRPQDPPNEIAWLDATPEALTLTRLQAPRGASGFSPLPPLHWPRRGA